MACNIRFRYEHNIIPQMNDSLPLRRHKMDSILAKDSLFDVTGSKHIASFSALKEYLDNMYFG